MLLSLFIVFPASILSAIQFGFGFVCDHYTESKGMFEAIVTCAPRRTLTLTLTLTLALTLALALTRAPAPVTTQCTASLAHALYFCAALAWP